MHTGIKKLFVFILGAVVSGAASFPGVVVAQEEVQEGVLTEITKEEEGVVVCYHSLRSIWDSISFQSSPSPLAKVAAKCNEIISQGGRVDRIDRGSAVQQGLGSIKVLDQHRGRFFVCYKNLLGLPEGVRNYDELLAHAEQTNDVEVTNLEHLCINTFCDRAWQEGPEKELEKRELLERTIQSEQELRTLRAKIDSSFCFEDRVQVEQFLDVSYMQGAVDRAVQQRVDSLEASAVTQGQFYASLGMGTLALVGLGLVAYRCMSKSFVSREDVDDLPSLRERVGVLGENRETVVQLRDNVEEVVGRLRRSDAARERRLQRKGAANN